MRWLRLGLEQPVPYELGAANLANAFSRLMLDREPTILLGQALPIVTVGDKPSDLPALATARSGGPTWFGPGVLLVAPVLFADPAAVHEALLQAAEATCTDFGLATVRRPHFPGLWVGGEGSWRKIASIGLAHEGAVVAGGGGLALNVDPDLRAFDDFDACGIPGVVVTSLAAETGRAIPVAEVAERFAAHLTCLLEPAQPVPAHA